MYTQADLQALASGQNPAIIAGSGQTQPITAVIVNQEQPNQQICDVGLTQSVNFDLQKVANCASSIIEYTLHNGAEAPREFVMGGNVLAGWHSRNPEVFAGAVFAEDEPLFTTASSFASLVPSVGVVQRFNAMATDGALLDSITIQTTSAALANQSITTYYQSLDVNNTPMTKTSYSPLCDCCVSNNDNGFLTRCWTMQVPLSRRQGWGILFPALTDATLRISIALFGIPNNAMNTAVNSNV